MSLGVCPVCRQQVPLGASYVEVGNDPGSSSVAVAHAECSEKASLVAVEPGLADDWTARTDRYAPTSTNRRLKASKGGRSWRIGITSDVAWIAGLPNGVTVATAIPLVFEAYATFYRPEHTTEEAHEQAVVEVLRQHTAEQPWWLGYLDTGAHDVVFPSAPRVSLYWDWPYVLVEAGPAEALDWRTGHMRGGLHGSLPDLFFPADRSWLVSGLWDDAWCCVAGSDVLIDSLAREPLANARRVQPDEDCVPPGLTRE
jgi:hypothetical protein